MADYYPLIPIASGLLILVLLCRHVVLSAFLARYGASTEGEIVGYQESSTAARMVVRFRTHEGQEIHARHDSTGWTASRYGDPVTVTYDPERPEKARIVQARWLSHWVEWMFAMLGVLLIVIGCFLAYFRWG